jgi:hypothetical protein
VGDVEDAKYGTTETKGDRWLVKRAACRVGRNYMPLREFLQVSDLAPSNWTNHRSSRGAAVGRNRIASLLKETFVSLNR